MYVCTVFRLIQNWENMAKRFFWGIGRFHRSTQAGSDHSALFLSFSALSLELPLSLVLTIPISNARSSLPLPLVSISLSISQTRFCAGQKRQGRSPRRRQVSLLGHSVRSLGRLRGLHRCNWCATSVEMRVGNGLKSIHSCTVIIFELRRSWFWPFSFLSFPASRSFSLSIRALPFVGDTERQAKMKRPLPPCDFPKRVPFLNFPPPRMNFRFSSLKSPNAEEPLLDRLQSTFFLEFAECSFVPRPLWPRAKRWVPLCVRRAERSAIPWPAGIRQRIWVPNPYPRVPRTGSQ
ncbi:uncharacterized protein EV422DRAFT_31925 [Fimicolochytrium jonesii]|uniref:uncharacterized protein n=1 Tax=Fimicolochytrium jonesii TaxID=1396493 RepID=UPI0022FDC45B|nr:uncharacterized protein EV422DRAFT_31925 [Fimicolochytrium jonesii]KAI8827215.1 hypothetical protein EV422DRAFT_31925 [Fimicolochytrium jonesii]